MPRTGLKVFALDRLPPGILLKRPVAVATTSMEKAAKVLGVGPDYLADNRIDVPEPARQQALSMPGMRIVLVLAMLAVLAAGCTSPAPASEPLSDWLRDYKADYQAHWMPMDKAEKAAQLVGANESVPLWDKAARLADDGATWTVSLTAWPNHEQAQTHLLVNTSTEYFQASFRYFRVQQACRSGIAEECDKLPALYSHRMDLDDTVDAQFQALGGT